jgi:hypothetical protein
VDFEIKRGNESITYAESQVEWYGNPCFSGDHDYARAQVAYWSEQRDRRKAALHELFVAVEGD